jgi:hypothetical protein
MAVTQLSAPVLEATCVGDGRKGEEITERSGWMTRLAKRSGY